MTPEPVTPEPVTPEPVTPEPVTPERMTPEPTPPDHLPLSRALAPALEWRAPSASTNSELVARAGELPDLTVLATDTQTAGRGRLDRVWSTPPGSALAVSVLLRHGGTGGTGGVATAVPAPDPRRLGWLPLLAGVAMARAVRVLGVPAATLKWPNDVLVESGQAPGKLSGILTELTAHGVVVGAGLNLTARRDELPVPTATSLALQGLDAAQTAVDRALAAYLEQLLPLVERWRAEGEPGALRALVEPELGTLGRAVRVDRPGLPVLIGSASALDGDGRLLVRPATTDDGNPDMVAVAAGDVTHLRYE